MKTLEEIIARARHEFHIRLSSEPSCSPERVARELSVSHLPSSSKAILVLAARNLELALEEPAHGPAFDGKPTAVNVIAANVSEAIYRALTAPEECHYANREKQFRDIFRELHEKIGRIANSHEMGERQSFHTENLYRRRAGRGVKG